MKCGSRKKRRGTWSCFCGILILTGSLILGINGYLWIGRQLAGNRLPMPFGYGTAVILSGSMEGTLSVNDLAVVHRQKEYEVGDIVVYEADGDLIIHRVIEKEGEKLVTKGDANNAPDAPIRLSDVKGKMIGHIPGVGGVVRRLKTPAGVFASLAVVVLLLEVSYWKEGSKEDEEQEKLREEIYRLKSALHESDGEM